VVVVLTLLFLLVVAGIASYCGWTADTRDPEYSLGRMTAPNATARDQNR
jgi:hypothetical protein